MDLSFCLFSFPTRFNIFPPEPGFFDFSYFSFAVRRALFLVTGTPLFATGGRF